MSFHVPEQYRVRNGRFATTADDGFNGMFVLPPLKAGSKNGKLRCIVSDGEGWEHVSVTVDGVLRCPTWEEMCYVQGQFWDPTDTVMQLHVPRDEWVSVHPRCLHLWRPMDRDIPRPPAMMVGSKRMSDMLEGRT